MRFLHTLFYDPPPSHILTVAQPISLSFFFNDTATTEIYTLSLHDALPILTICLHHWHCDASRPCIAQSDDDLFCNEHCQVLGENFEARRPDDVRCKRPGQCSRSEEHTSELQSPDHLVCRLLLEKKKMSQSEMGPAAWMGPLCWSGPADLAGAGTAPLPEETAALSSRRVAHSVNAHAPSARVVRARGLCGWATLHRRDSVC